MSKRNAITIPETRVYLGRDDLEDLTEQSLALVAAITTVDDELQCAHARDCMVEINTLVKDIEEQRVAAKKPFLETGKQIDALAKKISAPLEKCVTTLKIKLADYAMKVEVERQKVEMERRRLEALSAEKAKAEGRVPELVTTVELPLAADVALTTVTDYHVDINLLPREYCEPNEKKIRAAVAAGIEIPGVRVEKRKQVVAR